MKRKKTSMLDNERGEADFDLIRAAMLALADMAISPNSEFETIARTMSLGARCIKAREKRGLTVKEVAKQLKVPQYRIKTIESGTVDCIDSKVLPRYVSLLGLGRWAKKWAAANGELAAKLGLVGTAAKQAKKVPRKKKATTRKKAIPKKKATAKKPPTNPMSDLDIGYEEYLELYAEDNDGGKRPKLSKTKFAELSDEMMDLVNWENVERLPAAEKRRMEDLEYLLIA